MMTTKTKLIVISLFSLIAFLSSFYLEYDWIFPVETTFNPYIQLSEIKETGKFCDITSYFSCSKVTGSEYSKLLGIPFGIYGMFMFAFVFISAIFGLFKNSLNILKLIVIPTGIGVFINFYLFYLEIFVIKAFCPVCIFISILLFSMFFISLYPNLKCTTKQ